MRPGAAAAAPAEGRRTVGRGVWVLAALLFASFLGLGSWQLKRLFWKLDLIARVEQRAHAAPGAAPGPATWDQVSAAQDEYRAVRLEGRWLPQHVQRVQALTALGSGFWVLMPLQQASGERVWVNRGFVASAAAAVKTPPGTVSVTGLLRLSEPGGAFLRDNDPAQQRWYSRDVLAMSAAQGLRGAAPYFVDAAASAPPLAEGEPVGGLTVLRFQNNHLVYALTWYALAAGVLVAAWVMRRDGRGLGPAASP
jgi:surfeit locus 1 family protein